VDLPAQTVERLERIMAEGDSVVVPDLAAAALAPAIAAAAKRPREGDNGASVGDQPRTLLGKLQRLDPGIRAEEYFRGGGGAAGSTGDAHWDAQALEEDLRLTARYYCADALEETLRPLREEMRRFAEASVQLPRPSGAVEVIPRVLLLGDAGAAQDLATLRQQGVVGVVNCSPQTVKTGKSFYGPSTDYLELWQDDFSDYCALQDFDAVWALSTRGGGPCLLHCEQGVNRSGCLAVAVHMKYLAETAKGHLPPEEMLRRSWRCVAECRGSSRLLTNPSFQRQLLLFARLGCRWFPSVNQVWRTSKERQMAQFRALAERIGQKAVSDCGQVERGAHWRAVIYIRDGSMRGEMKMEKGLPFDLSSDAALRTASSRIHSYAVRSMPKLSSLVPGFSGDTMQ